MTFESNSWRQIIERTTNWKPTKNPTIDYAFESDADLRDLEDAKKERNNMWALLNESYNSYMIFRNRSIVLPKI